jgi:LL-diaminopimelate aminotransferase
MVQRNIEIAKLKSNYLFVEIGERKKKLLRDCPRAQIINLGIGDTTEPIPGLIIDSFIKKAKELGTRDGYTGYGEDFGHPLLREKIAQKLYKGLIDKEDIFISDGAKCDLGRLQLLFGKESQVCVQDPSYPVYVATSVMTGKADAFTQSNGQYGKIIYMPCEPKNNFFPNTETIPVGSIICICSPNNPTGAVLTSQQLKKLIDIAKEKESIIIFDSAYSSFIRDPSLPKSIYEIEGADEVAIEISSFSKIAGFTGVRLGWSIIPKKLKFKDGSSVQADWIKIITTFFNGASNIAQAGGITLISDEGLRQSSALCNYYLENAKILKEAMTSKKFVCHGGDNAPYLWVDINEKNSWDFFDEILEKMHIVTTPGIGFGPIGEGFLRLSSFGKRENILEAAKRIKEGL